MIRNRSLILPLAVIFLLLATSVQIPDSDGIMTGPVVTVDAGVKMMIAGTSTPVSVKVENVDGESSTPMDLVEVRLSVELGTFEPETAITDIDGYCTFTYTAPDEVDGPTDVTITAFAETGVLDASGSDEVTVTYRLEGVILGPSQVEVGGKSENYVLKVTAGGEPVRNVNVMPLVMGAGTLGTYSRQTDAMGEAVLTIHPGDAAGQINMIIQLGSQEYLSSAASKAVNVVEELAPLEIQVDLGTGSMTNWGARRITAKVVRGDDSVGGVAVFFRSSLGYFLNERVLTDQTGDATGIFIASHDNEGSIYDVNINISTSDGVEIAFFEGIQRVNFNDVNVDLDFWYIPSGDQLQSQLYPGEQLINEPEIRGRTNYAADMSLKFLLYGGILGNYTSILATGLNTFDLSDGYIKEEIYKPGVISVYTVPDDPVEGTYTYRYILTDRTGAHTYRSFTPQQPDSHSYHPIEVFIHSEGQNDWTFMYYLAGDNDLAPHMDLELERLESEAPNGQFKVYVMFDRSIGYDEVSYYDGEKWRGAKKFDLEDGRESGTGPDWVSSSTAIYLYEFMLWASYQSPSGHYGLVLSDHGKGYKGMCWDQRTEYNTGGGLPPPDHLSLQAIQNALHLFNMVRRKVDVVTLAACGMSCVEMATIIAPGTDYIVASQLPTYSDHGLTTEKVLEHLKGYDWNSHSPTPFQVSVDFVNGFIERSGGTQYDSSICVIETEHVQDFAVSFNATMRLIFNNWELLGESFSTAYDQTTRVPGPEPGEFENGDLKEFLVNLREEVSSFILNPTGRSVFNKLGNCIEKFDEIVAYAHLIQGLNGIDLYMPTEPIPTNLGIFNWDYFWVLPFSVNYYISCLVLHSGGEFYQQGGNGDQYDDFTPLDPVQGHIIDDDGNGLGNRVVINLTPSQNIEQQPVFRVVIDCLQFSGKGGGYLSDMLKKRIVLDQDDIAGIAQLEVKLPVTGWYTIIARVLDENNEIVQKFIVGNYTMEKSDPEGGPPSLNITASSTTLTVGDRLDLTAVSSDPDGDELDIFWDFDHRNGIFFDSDEDAPSTRYLKPGNATVTCIATDGEFTVVKTIDIVVGNAVGNNVPTAGMTSEVDQHGVVTLDASDRSSDPDGDMLFFKFNFGDGNWTDWLEEDEASHHYSQIGIYNCSLRVMDIRGAVSEREFQLVTVETVSNITGQTGDDEGDDGIDPVIIAVTIAVAIVIVLLIAAMVSIFVYALHKRKEDREEGEGWEDEEDDDEKW